MAKKPTLTTVSSGFNSTTTLNNNFIALTNAFDNTLSLDGSTPNAMNADLDMNSNDLLNVGEVDTESLRINGVLVAPSSVVTAPDASVVSYNQGGAGAVSRTVANRLRDYVSVKDFGAVGDGVTDDTVAIQAAITASDGTVVFPRGNYRTTDTITFPTGQYENLKVVFEGARVTLDADNKPVLRFGTQANPPLFTGYFAAYGLDVSQAAGRTGNTGIALDNVYASYFQINNILDTEYGLVLTGANSRGTAYNNIDLGNVFNTQYGIQFNGVSSGFANQNTIRGGKLISNPGATAILNTGNENTFVGTSIEGTWTTGVEITNRGGVYINVRTEGTFTQRWDLSAAPTGGFANNFIGCYSDAVTWGTYGPDYPVTQLFQGALSANTQTVNRSHYIGRNTSNTGNPVLEIVDGYTSSGTSRPLRTRSGRAAGVAHEIYAGTVLAGSVNHNIGGISFESESNSYFQGFMRFGTYYIWVDNSGVLRIKNGVPTSQTDGTVVGTQT